MDHGAWWILPQTKSHFFSRIKDKLFNIRLKILAKGFFEAFLSMTTYFLSQMGWNSHQFPRRKNTRIYLSLARAEVERLCRFSVKLSKPRRCCCWLGWLDGTGVSCRPQLLKRAGWYFWETRRHYCHCRDLTTKHLAWHFYHQVLFYGLNELWKKEAV